MYLNIKCITYKMTKWTIFWGGGNELHVRRAPIRLKINGSSIHLLSEYEGNIHVGFVGWQHFHLQVRQNHILPSYPVNNYNIQSLLPIQI